MLELYRAGILAAPFISEVQDAINNAPESPEELTEIYVMMKRSGVAADMVARVGNLLKAKRGPRGAGPADVAAVLCAAAFQLGYHVALQEKEKPANVQ
jgi:hypothetical protein